MPTYVSNATEKMSAGGITFLPGKEVELHKYINLNDYPWLSKKSELPLIKSQAKLVFDNITDTTNMSPIYTLDNMKVLEIKDGEDPNADDDFIEVRIFMGHTDDQADFVPYNDLMKFKRITQKDENGTEYPYWYPVKEEAIDYEENLIPATHWPVTYPFFSIAVVSANVSGKVNVYMRDVRQITHHMV